MGDCLSKEPPRLHKTFMTLSQKKKLAKTYRGTNPAVTMPPTTGPPIGHLEIYNGVNEHRQESV